MRIAINDLTVRFAGIVALDRISGALESGRITVILGPNAAGKSTLLRAMLGLVRPFSGRIEIGGDSVLRLHPRDLARRAAYVPQRPSVSAAFTVREVVELGRFALSPNRPRIDEAIERLDLAGIAHRMFPELSVGQQQRVSLARALAQLEQGGCLLLDEPTAAMDVRHELMAFREIRRVAAAGATVVLSLHDLNAAASIADEVWILKDSRLVSQMASPASLTPEVLESVYEVAFLRIDDGAGGSVFAPRRDGLTGRATM